MTRVRLRRPLRAGGVLALVALVAIVAAACGGGSASTPATAPTLALPLPPTPPRASASASSKLAQAVCLAPWEHALGDPKVDPKPLDAERLAEIDRLGGGVADETERAFARSRTYFEAQRWVEAAQGFRAIAFDHPDMDMGIYAAQLYLECLNVLGSRAARPQCYADMARDVPQLIDLYCTTRRAAHEQECTTLEHIQSDLLRLQAQSTFERADQAGDPTTFHASGEKYLALLRSDCLGGAGKTGARCDELAYNAIVSFLAAGDKASATRVKTLMADPKNGMAQSPLLLKAACRVDGICPP